MWYKVLSLKPDSILISVQRASKQPRPMPTNGVAIHLNKGSSSSGDDVNESDIGYDKEKILRDRNELAPVMFSAV